MSDIYNLDSSKLFQANNENSLIDWNLPDISEMDIFSKFNEKPNHSENYQNLIKIETNTEFEQKFLKQFSKNTVNEDDFLDKIGYNNEHNFKEHRKIVEGLSNSPNKNIMPEQQYFSNFNDKQVTKSSSFEPFSMGQMIILNNIKNCFLNHLGSPFGDNKKHNFNNNLNNINNMNENKISKKNETYDLNNQLRRLSDDILSRSRIASAEFFKKEKITNLNESELGKKHNSFDNNDPCKNFLNKKNKNTSEEISNGSLDPISEKKEIQQCLKLIKNRLSAKKSRQKKKVYIQSLENELAKTKEELEYYKNLCKTQVTSFDQKFKQMESKEVEYFKMEAITFSQKYTLVKSDELAKIKNDYKLLQDSIIIDLFKTMVKSLIPLELKFFENKILKLKDITNFDTLDILLEKIIANQLELGEMCNFELCRKDKFSFPLKIYLFLEQLKFFSIRFREFLFEMNNINSLS